MKLSWKTSLATVISIAALGGATQAAAESGVKIGTLSCQVAGGWGLILGSSRALHCSFVGQDMTTKYEGNITKIGVDIGYQSSGIIVWTVFAPTSSMQAGALAGSYGGVTAGATFGVGLGANVLVGGGDKSIALQPLSVQGTTGLNVAAGIGGLSLKYHPGE